jgi:TonB family protein
MSSRSIAGLALAIYCSSYPLSSAADAYDYSKEAVVIQDLTTKVSFAADGAKEWRQTLSARIQSEGAVRQFGVLAFSYGSATDQITIEYVRVKKANGSVVVTPNSSIMDVATEVATVAPTYSDLRQKQIPVKALGVGDVLEYSVRIVEQSPEIPGQFWYAQDLPEDGVILNQSIEIRVPKSKYVQVSSPKLKPEIHEEEDQRVYIWRHSHLDPGKPDPKQKPATEPDPPKIQLTTFRNWEEVGTWWGTLASTQAAVTPAIEAKAKELTGGLSSDAEKEKAIYAYVALKFRYISISLGAGRYRPHTAAEVLANEYGDCKDKHTLFASLLKAVGIQAWPALMGAGIKFDASVPSPAQFNHVITVLPQHGKYVWLDTTAEVAPFGLLNQAIRDEEALVIPFDGKTPGAPLLVKTPVDPPFTTSETVDVKASLASDGTLTGHFDWELTGDSAVGFRSGFRQLAPVQWQTLAQQISYSLNYAGEVSAVSIENLEDIEKPFHLSYDYTRKNFSDWQEHKITPPVPPLGFGPGEDAEKPKEPFWAGAPGVTTYRASLQLPKDFVTEAPPDTTLNNDFAGYSSHYSLKDGTLIAERKMTIKQAKVTGAQWAEYQKFSKGIRDEQTRFVSLSATGGVQMAANREENPEADELMRRVYPAWQAGNMNEVRELLGQVERLNPQQPRLWSLLGTLELVSANLDAGIADYRKEIQNHPEETQAYQELSAILVSAGRRDEAIELWRGALALKPADEVSATQLADLLIAARRYAEVPAILEKPIAAAPERYHLQVTRVDALLREGQKDRGLAEAQKIAAATSESMLLNNLAYSLSDTGSALGLAQELAQKAVSQIERDCAKVDIDSLEPKDLQAVDSLSVAWDTLGWVYVKQNETLKGEKYLDAAWRLSQYAAIADHLGQIYEKQGKHSAAIHMWRWALASNNKDEEAQERLRKAGAPVIEPFVKPVKGASVRVSAGQELGELRTIKVPDLADRTGSAEFFLLLSPQGIQDTRFISGIDALSQAGEAIKAAKYEFAFPDSGPEKIVRRGVLSCSAYTVPSCNLTLLLPRDSQAAQVRAGQLTGDHAKPGADVKGPTLLAKSEPEYTKAARDAKIEGTVVLKIVIDQAGIPKETSVVNALGFGLDEQAQQCVLRWRFNPKTINGKPIGTEARVEVNFRLQKDPPQN